MGCDHDTAHGRERTVIYAVDDEPFTVNLWLQFEADETFGDVRFEGSDRIDKALDFAESADAGDRILFVLDSRMPIDPATFERMRSLIDRVYHIDVAGLRSSDVFTGVIAAAALKLLRPSSMVILLTAFLKEIEDPEEEALLVSNLLNIGAECILGKPTSEAAVLEAVQRSIAELNKRGPAG